MGIVLLQNIVLVSALALGIIYLFHKLKIPSIVGLLLTGILIGPYGLKWITQIAEVESLAEIGVVLLLFSIGLESSLNEILRSKKTTLIAGLLQIGLTIALTTSLVTLTDLSLPAAFLSGCIVSLSSTAIVMKILQERRESNTPHGRAALGVLILQDLMIVPMLLIVPMLGDQSSDIGAGLFGLVAKSFAIIILTILAAKYGVPKLLQKVARTRSNELFLVAIIVICFTITWLTDSAGLSLALGAFLSGLIISESEFGSHALGKIIPFRDIFASLFFVATGMLLNWNILATHAGSIIALTLGVIILKMVIATVAMYAAGLPLKAAILAGGALSQIGEFSLILAQKGAEYELFSAGTSDLILATTILTMIATPLIVACSRPLAEKLGRLPNTEKEAAKEEELKDHIVIIGFGNSGRSVSHAAQLAKISHAIIDMNTETIKKERLTKKNVVFGDATQSEVLEKVNISAARVIVIAINDPHATKHIVKACREHNPTAKIIARVQFTEEEKEICKHGADEVISEEQEAAKEILDRTLRTYGLQETVITDISQQLSKQDTNSK